MLSFDACRMASITTAKKQTRNIINKVEHRNGRQLLRVRMLMCDIGDHDGRNRRRRRRS